MKHTFLIAGIAALAISAPVLAQSSPSLAADTAEPAVTPAIVLAQALAARTAARDRRDPGARRGRGHRPERATAAAG